MFGNDKKFDKLQRHIENVESGLDDLKSELRHKQSTMVESVLQCKIDIKSLQNDINRLQPEYVLEQEKALAAAQDLIAELRSEISSLKKAATTVKVTPQSSSGTTTTATRSNDNDDNAIRTSMMNTMILSTMDNSSSSHTSSYSSSSSCDSYSSYDSGSSSSSDCGGGSYGCD